MENKKQEFCMKELSTCIENLSYLIAHPDKLDGHAAYFIGLGNTCSKRVNWNLKVLDILLSYTVDLKLAIKAYNVEEYNSRRKAPFDELTESTFITLKTNLQFII